MKKSLLKFVSVGALFLCSGCLIDNQKIANPEDLQVVNPEPTSRNFAANNANHKVLMAVIDTGVDYNHPLLADHMHFDLDAQGKPTGLGKDFIGDDNWPSPYIARTSVYDSTLKDDDAQKAVANRDAVASILANEPSLSDLLDLHRNAGQEFSEGAYHGTHVAGLMTYDRPDFGLRAYRVLPTARTGNDDNRDMTTESIDQIVAAIDAAAKDGARIVNMSLGMDFDKAIKGDDSDDDVANAEKMQKLLGKLSDTLKKYPNVLFVAAAGNEGVWKDGANKLGMPCGAKAPNMLCVGALRDNGDPTTFTSFPIGGVDLVFALGQNVLSTLPSRMCVAEGMKDVGSLGMMGPADDTSALAKQLVANCAKSPGMGLLSGTSMASPIVAHAAGEVLAANPGFTPAQIIKALYARSTPDFVGTMPVYKLRIVKPSWYAKKPTGPMNGGHKSLMAGASSQESSSGYWEGFAPIRSAK